MPSSDFALSRPAAAASLNDWSPRPPMSYARPTLRAFLVLELVLLLDAPESSLLPQAARARAATEVTATIFITRRKGVSFYRCPVVRCPVVRGIRRRRPTAVSPGASRTGLYPRALGAVRRPGRGIRTVTRPSRRQLLTTTAAPRPALAAPPAPAARPRWARRRRRPAGSPGAGRRSGRP